MITDEKHHLTLRDIAGLPVGHVPRGLASSFRTLLDWGANIFAEPLEEHVPSFPPWPAQNDPMSLHNSC